MRKTVNFNADWLFAKQADLSDKTAVTLPHTWNAEDGMDGGSDYYRARCYYVKEFEKASLPEADKYYLEIRGANSSADVKLNGEHLAHHDGGYSTWRVDITVHLKDANSLTIEVDNAPNETVYPQVADFTFYGGLYRDVNIICVNDSHFDLDYYGGTGLKITPAVNGANADVEVEVYLTNAKPEHTVRYTLYDRDEAVVAAVTSSDTKVVLPIENVHLWHGRKDPYLYCCEVELLEGEYVIDSVCSRFGCRTFRVDPEKGFILNGEEYPLRGVSRHQDRIGFGNALKPEHHEEDIDLIMEVGATTIRLAHYQHDQYFYDLCDEKGLVIWAEIPYISRHMPTGRENTISQMRELITQNYNHASIVCWGLSNEITISGATKDLYENHVILNDLCHEMDKTRPTTIACVSMCDISEAYVHIPDLVSYNHYFGWYGGDTDMNGPWFDNFHATYPDTPIGCSEYGCEALNWHTSNPTQGDYTEEYQAYYHEELIKQLFSRKYMWATHVWNMFDFGADGRDEGGEGGQNHKGLITIDRKYKKDSFYAYKAWLSDEKFVHLCGKRYIDRVEDVTKVTVYSNMPEVELFANGESLGKKTAEDHFFYFDVPNVGETHLIAVAGELKDESDIRKVAEFNEAYRLVEKNAVINWFDVTTREGYFSINDKLGDIFKSFRGKITLGLFMKNLMPKKGAKVAGDFEMSADMMKMMNSFTVLRLSSMVGMANITISKEQLLDLNKKLNKIKKPKK